MKTLIQISRTLAKQADALRFAPPVAHVYNPLIYARKPHEAYLNRYGQGPKPVILLGMNPGPFGMMQTGVPFGDVTLVKDFLEIDEAVDRPERQHPKRPIDGFSCKRSEISGTRLWGFVRERFHRPSAFFSRFFVVNYCPLVFLEVSGKNRTPDKLPQAEKAALFRVCDNALRDTARILDTDVVIGVGSFASARAKAALSELNITTGTILHPSPASPAANRGWATQAEAQLETLGVL